MPCRRRELAELSVELAGKAEHIRTVPVPEWVKQTIR